MVAVVAGGGLGLGDTSALLLGSRGIVGNATVGRGNDRVYLNAATGNLIVQSRDELLLGRGLDIAVNRAYNSLGQFDYGNGDNWLSGLNKRVYGLTGTLKTAGSTVKRADWDGTELVYTYSTSLARYQTTGGDGAHDFLTISGSVWTWTNGDTRVTETYDNANGGRITGQRDPSGNQITYTYNASGQLTRVQSPVTVGTTNTTESVYLDYSGALLTQVRTVYKNGSNDVPRTRVRYEYDTSNRLSRVRVDLSPDDNLIGDNRTYDTTYTYDGTSKRVASITQSDGSRLDFVYTLIATTYRVTRITQTAASGVTRVTNIAYDTVGRTTTLTDALGYATIFTYDTQNRLSKITAPAVGGVAQAVQFGYDADGNVASVADAKGNVVTYQYNAQGLITLQRDQAGNTVTRTYNTNNQLDSETVYFGPDPDGAGTGLPTLPATTRYIYDAAHRLRYVRTAEGRVREYQYTSQGLRTAALEYSADLHTGTTYTEAALTSWRNGLLDKSRVLRADFTFDYRGALASELRSSRVRADGVNSTTAAANEHSETRYVYDSFGNLLQRLPTIGSTAAELYAYDGLGRLLTSRDLNNAQTVYTYDDANNKTLTTFADGLIRTQVHNKAGELLTVLEGQGTTTLSTTQYRYDALGRLRYSQDPTGVRTHVLYDEASRKVAEIDADGSFTEFFYDANNLLIRTLRYANNLSAAALAGLVDASGNPLNVKLGAAGSAVSTTSIPRPTASSTTDRKTWKLYDAANRLHKEVDARGAVTEYFYDGASRLVKTTAWASFINLTTFAATPTSANATPTANAAADRTTRYFYSNDGKLLGTLDGEGYVVEHKYNGAGLKFQTVRYADATATADRAAAALATLITNRGSANRAKDSTEHFIYDARGLLRTQVDGEGNRTFFGYDQYGNIKSIDRGRKIDPTLLTTPQSVTIQFQARATVAGAVWPTVQIRIDGVVVGTVTVNSATLTTYTVAATGVVPAANHTIDFAYTNDDGIAGSTTTSRSVWISNGVLKAGIYTQAFNTVTNAALKDVGSGTAAFDGVSVTEVTPNTEQLLDVNAALRFTAYQWAHGGFAVAGPTLESTAFVYNAYGQLQSKTITLAGAATETDTYTYDALRRRTSETRASNTTDPRTSRVRYDVQGRVTMELGGRGAEALAALGATPTQLQIDAVWTAWAVKYGYDSAGRRVSMTDANGHKTLYYYNGDGKLTHTVRKATDAAGTVFGEVVEHRYDAFNHLSDTIVYGGRLSATTFNALTGGLVTSALTTAVTAIANTATDTRTQFVYNTTGTLQARRDYTNATAYDATTFAYNAFLEQISRTSPTDGTNAVILATTLDRRGLATASALDASGLNLTTAAVYDAFGRVTQTTDARGIVRTVTYDRAGRQVQVKDGNAQTESLTYDALGNVLTRIDRRGQTTRYAYDPFGRKVTVTTPENIQTISSYNAYGQLARVQIVGTGTNTVYTYDKAGNLKTTTVASGPLNLLTTNNYDNANRLISTVDARGTTTTYGYDAANRVLTRTVDAGTGGLNLITRYAYSGKGQTVSVTDAGGTVTATTYDAKGQTTQVAVDPSGLNLRTQFAYDKRGNALTVTEGAGTTEARATQYTYDKAGRLTRTVVDPGTGKLNITTNYAYDKNGNVATKTDARGYITRYAYDNENGLRFTLDATNGLTETLYDAGGNVSQLIRYANFQAAAVITTTASGGNTTHTINTASISKDATRDRVTTYAYDKDSRRTFERDALGGLTQLKYDAAGNVIQRTQYANRISTTAAPIINGFTGVTITPNATLDRTTRYAYDEANRAVFVIDALGYVSESAFDANGNVTKVVGYYNAVNVAGNPSVATVRTAITLNAANDRVVRTVFDRANRAVYRVDPMGYAKKAEYDAVGRVTRSLHYAQVISVTDTDTVATVAAKLPAAPDVNTRVTRSVYDRGGRLTNYFDADGATEVSVTRNIYDVLGQTIETIRAYGTSAASSTRRTYDKAGRVSAETRGFGTVDAATTRFGYDGLGNRTSVVDPRGVELAETDTAWAVAERKALGYLDSFGNPKLATALTPAEQTALRDRYTARFTFDSLGRKTVERDPLGGQTTTTFDALGDAVRVTDQRGNSGYFYFDRLGQNVFFVDPEGFASASSYDSFGGKISTTQYFGRAQRTWSTTAQPVAVTTVPASGPYVLIDSARDATVTYEYDRNGQVTKRTDAENVFGTSNKAYETFGYDAFGNRTSYRNKVGGTTAYTYDRRGLQLTETLPVTTKTSAGSTISVVNRNSYDARGNRIQLIEAEGAAEQRTTSFTFDRLDRLTRTLEQARTIYRAGIGYTSNVVPTLTNTYDARGNVTSRTDANGGRTAWYYDALDRRTAEVNAAGTLSVWTYDRSGNAISSKVYADPVSLPAGATPPPPVNPANVRETLFKYDANNRNVQKTIPGLVLGRQNDAIGKFEIGATFGLDKAVTNRFYDAAGNVIKTIDANGGVSYFFYGKDGQKILEVDQDGYGVAWTRGYNSLVTRERRFALKHTSVINETSNAATLISTWPTNAADRITDLVYDRAFRVTSETRLNVAYGAVNSSTGTLTESTGTSTTSFAYDGLDNTIRQTDANGRVTDRAFDLIGRLLREQLPTFTDYQGASVRHTTDYEYNGLNNVTRVLRRGKDNSTESDDQVTRLTYGIGGRLASQTDAIGQITNFAYDAQGNLTFRYFQRRNADGALVTDGSVQRYDAMNREVSRQTTSQVGTAPWTNGALYETRYNAHGEVTGRRTNGGGTDAPWQEVAEYNALGKAWKTNSGNGVTKIFLYDGNGNATLSIESAGTDLTGLTLNQVLAINTNETYRTISVYDKRNNLVRVTQPGMNAIKDVADVQQFSAQQVQSFPGGSGQIGNNGLILSTQPTGSTTLPPLSDAERFQPLSSSLAFRALGYDGGGDGYIYTGIALDAVTVNLNVASIGQHLGGWDRVQVVVEYWTNDTSGVRETTTTNRNATSIQVNLGVMTGVGNNNFGYRVSVYFKYTVGPGDLLVAQSSLGAPIAWEEITQVSDGESGYTTSIKQHIAQPTTFNNTLQTFDLNGLRTSAVSSTYALRQDVSGPDYATSWLSWYGVSDGEGGWAGAQVNGVTVRVPTPSFNETFGAFQYVRVEVYYHLSGVVAAQPSVYIYNPAQTDVWIPINAFAGAGNVSFTYSVKVTYQYANAGEELTLAASPTISNAMMWVEQQLVSDGEGGYTVVNVTKIQSPGAFDQSFWTSIAGWTIFTSNADTLNSDRVYFYYRTSTALPYNSFEVPRAALSPGGAITRGVFQLHNSWLPAGVVDYKLVYMQGGAITAVFNGSSINATVGLNSESRSQVGTIFFTSDNSIHFFDQQAPNLRVELRRSGTSDSWYAIDLGRYAGVANWFSLWWGGYGFSGSYDVRVLRRDAVGNVTARTFTQVNFSGTPSATAPVPYAEGLVQVSGQPSNSATMSFRYRPNGSTGAWLTGPMSNLGGGRFQWDTQNYNLMPVVTAGSVYDYEYQYDTYDAGGLRVNGATGVFRVTPNSKSFLSHNTSRVPTLVSFSIDEGAATRLDLQYRPSGSTGAYIAAPSMTRSGTNLFKWDASAITPLTGSSTYEYVYRLYDAGGNALRNPLGDPIVVTGQLTLGNIASAEPTTGWVITGTAETGDVINRRQAFNAFGEVGSETDGRGHVTDFSYNTMGQLVMRQQPTTDITGENGVTTRARPTTRYYYDLTGKAVATRDANGYVTSQIWNDSQPTPVVATEFRPDGGKVTNSLDVFGNVRTTSDPLGRQTQYTYDKLDQLTRIDRPIRAAGQHLAGQRAWETYEYDSAGNRIAATNVLGRSRTYFDAEGRVTAYTSIEGRTTGYSYVYDANILGAGNKRVGGWQKTTSLFGVRSEVQKADVFNRLTWQQDYGGHTFNYTYNHAGWLTQQTNNLGQNLTYEFYANGYLKRQLDNKYHLETKYAYDNNGNRVYESYRRSNVAGGVYANTEVIYDELNRVVQASDPKYTIRYKYDAVGNRRNVYSYYNDGLDGARQVQDYWYRYDSMDRFVVTMGQLSGGAISRGTTGKEVLYNTASERVQVDYYNEGTGQTFRERYTYTAEGYLQDMYLRTWTGSAWSAEQLSSKRNNDLAGRVLAYQDWTNGGALRTNLTRSFDRDNRQLNEVDLMLPYSGQYKTDTYTYNTDGSLARIDTSNVAVTQARTFGYEWWGSAKQTTAQVQAATASVPSWAPGNSLLTYDSNGNLYRATDVSGKRTIQYVTDGDGQIMYRQELAARSTVPTDWNGTEAVGGDVQRRRSYYYLNGNRIGDVSNDGQFPSTVDYAEALAQQRPVSNDDRNRRFTPVAYANFDENYQPINEAYPGIAPFEYVVARGDTLGSIALRIWGDRNLWWMIADANGLSGAETLVEGMRLVIPNKVTNIHNNAGTFKVYNAGEAIGNTSPTLPDPPPPPAASKGCGGVGKILMVVVAVVVSYFVGPWAAGVIQGMGASAAVSAVAGGAVAGAAASTASQAVGVATGVQDRFSWRQVGLGALGGAVTAGLNGLPRFDAYQAPLSTANWFSGAGGAARYLQTGANAAITTTITQGIGSALGMSSFSWRAVATSAVAAPIGMYVGEQVGSMLPKNGFLANPTVTDTLTGTARAAVSQSIRMAVYNKGKLDWSSMALDAFGSAIGNSFVSRAVGGNGVGGPSFYAGDNDDNYQLSNNYVKWDGSAENNNGVQPTAISPTSYADFDDGYRLPLGYVGGDNPSLAGRSAVTAGGGDSLWKIAERQLGSGATTANVNEYKNKLLAINPHLGNDLRVGQEVRLPEADTVADVARGAAMDRQMAERVEARVLAENAAEMRRLQSTAIARQNVIYSINAGTAVDAVAASSTPSQFELENGLAEGGPSAVGDAIRRGTDIVKATWNNPQEAAIGFVKKIANFGPEIFNGAADLLKFSASGYVGILEEVGVLRAGAMNDFRSTDPLRVTPLFAYNGDAQLGGSLLGDVALVAAPAKWGSYGVVFEDIRAVGPMASQMGAVRLRLINSKGGPVELTAPANATPAEIDQIRQYVALSNEALEAGLLSSTGRVSTGGALRQDATRSARVEKLRAETAGKPYVGHVGHVPDTTWLGKADPYTWLDLAPRVNMSLGSQAATYPVGYKPSKFIFKP